MFVTCIDYTMEYTRYVYIDIVFCYGVEVLHVQCLYINCWMIVCDSYWLATVSWNSQRRRRSLLW